ncbi:iron-sulfur cluster assembly scaffold protein [Maricaulis sp.]|uniref:iron-sulfur cluster assembly scaffold protein n=1 Tax=Maricaulis sp. TaxID=1486257 RepID=UPI00260AAE3B|nr:iron-sulfur cluster assembly scaffold protein [Maricaulis sp.]
MTDHLYSSDVLRLAADIPRLGALDAPDARVRKVARLCGSELELDLRCEDDRIADLALRVKACALGQAAAAVLARHALGATAAEIRAGRDGLKAMLKDGAAPPQGRFAELAALEGARDYPARHQSVLLAFEAALDAIEATSRPQTLTA